MARTPFPVEVLTPEGEVFNGEVEMISAAHGRNAGYAALAISLRYAAAAPPWIGSEPHSAEGHPILKSRPSRSREAMPAIP